MKTVMLMSSLDAAVDIGQLTRGELWVVYGKSGSGKTWFLSTFPKPILYLQFGDDGYSTIQEEKGIKIITVKDQSHLETLLKDARKDNKYKTIAVDTFSLIVNEWIDENAVQKNKRVTQQMWGDLKTDTEKLIKMSKTLSQNHIVVLTCHESTDSIEGMEDEITPDVRPSVSKGARTYLESMANFGIHMTVIEKEVEDKNGVPQMVARHATHLSPNPYYWTKIQKSANIKVPKMVINPSYDKIIKLMKGEK